MGEAAIGGARWRFRKNWRSAQFAVETETSYKNVVHGVQAVHITHLLSEDPKTVLGGGVFPNRLRAEPELFLQIKYRLTKSINNLIVQTADQPPPAGGREGEHIQELAGPLEGVPRWPHGCRRQCSEVAVPALVGSNLTEGGGFFSKEGTSAGPWMCVYVFQGRTVGWWKEDTTARSAGFKSQAGWAYHGCLCCISCCDAQKGKRRREGGRGWPGKVPRSPAAHKGKKRNNPTSTIQETPKACLFDGCEERGEHTEYPEEFQEDSGWGYREIHGRYRRFGGAGGLRECWDGRYREIYERYKRFREIWQTHIESGGDLGGGERSPIGDAERSKEDSRKDSARSGGYTWRSRRDPRRFTIQRDPEKIKEDPGWKGDLADARNLEEIKGDLEDTHRIWKRYRDIWRRYRKIRKIMKTNRESQRDPEDIHGDPKEIQEDLRSREIKEKYARSEMLRDPGWESTERSTKDTGRSGRHKESGEDKERSGREQLKQNERGRDQPASSRTPSNPSGGTESDVADAANSVSLPEPHVLRSLKKGLSINDLGNYFPGSIREAVSARADKGTLINTPITYRENIRLEDVRASRSEHRRADSTLGHMCWPRAGVGPHRSRAPLPADRDRTSRVCSSRNICKPLSWEIREIRDVGISEMGKYREIYERYREIWQNTRNLEEIKGDLEDTHRIWKRSSVKTTEKFVEDTRRCVIFWWGPLAYISTPIIIISGSSARVAVRAANACVGAAAAPLPHDRTTTDVVVLFRFSPPLVLIEELLLFDQTGTVHLICEAHPQLPAPTHTLLYSGDPVSRDPRN
ncbi:hypothetical protein GEV33_009828 [Tenebrio molitor]|uniref:Uncharacterized protein n=1 Tax=Tenebrio molitor TaxID=7067 RepID=A0A8J6LAI4_TENMO|nr:hypothetical protein GEV33_009828 [Tenebrio molitor]